MSKAVAAQPASSLSRLWHKWRFHINILLLLVPLGFMPKYFADASLFRGDSGLGERDIGTVQVKAAYLRIGKPRSLRAAGVIFFGTPYRMGATLPIPERTKADAELWITLEGWDGSMHQASIPLSQASPATVAWLTKQGGKP